MQMLYLASTTGCMNFIKINLILSPIKKIMGILLLFIFFILCPAAGYTQSPVSAADISKLKKVISLDSVEHVFVPANTDVQKEYRELAGSFFKKKPSSIPAEKISSKILVRFQLANTGQEEVSCYFFPWFYFKNVLIYKIEADSSITALPGVAPNLKDSVSFRLITVPANDTIHILAECFQLKTYSNFLRPKIINHEYVGSYILEIQGSKKEEALFTYVFCGLLMMMVLFSLANFFTGKSKEFLYYAAYALFLGTMLFTKKYYLFRSNNHSFFIEEYLDFILQGIGICFFMAFMIHFLETRKKYPFLHKLYSFGIWFVIVTLLLFSYLHYGTNNYLLEELLENYITKGILLVMIIIFLVYAARNWQNKLFRYLFFGNLFFLLFSIASLSLVITPKLFQLPGILKSSLVLYELGLLLELTLFLVALTYKNRVVLIERVMEGERLKLENERKELEKQMAVVAAQQEERERISADMHDELGSGMTTIRLMSEIAKNKMKDNVPVEIEKISTSSNDLLNKMNAIIWSMNSSNDTVDNLISYIRAYAIEYLDGTSIHCKINTPETIPQTEISGDKRRNIFLCLKETLNNALKHSNATELTIDITTNKNLVIKVSDNGIGIDLENTRQFGNGLKNIARRMKNIGGTYTIRNNKGTETILELQE